VINAVGTGPFVLLDEVGELVAVYERHGDSSVKPILVYAAAPSGGASAEPTPAGE
jgi:hypothetical protein